MAVVQNHIHTLACTLPRSLFLEELNIENIDPSKQLTHSVCIYLHDSIAKPL